MTKRVAIVVQRYAETIIGGAEAHARSIAEHLQHNHQVEVLTTCAASYVSWRNVYAPGVDHLNGVTVRRFPVVGQRWQGFGFFSRLLLVGVGLFRSLKFFSIQKALEDIWLRAQGPQVPALVNYIKEHSSGYDLMVFFTYLYYPTQYGLPAATCKTILVPTAHDEPALYFATTERMLQVASVVFPNTPAEADLLRKVSPNLAAINVVGVGLSEEEYAPSPGAKSNPYFLYLGRIGRGKGVTKLVQWFDELSLPCPLLLAGAFDQPQRMQSFLQRYQNTSYCGQVHSAEKVKLLQQATCLVNPSEKESLSLVVLEAILCRIPVIVNAKSAVLLHYAKELPSVFAYRNQNEFAQVCRTVLATDWTDPEGARALATSRRWVIARYNWQRVISAYEQVLH